MSWIDLSCNSNLPINFEGNASFKLLTKISFQGEVFLIFFSFANLVMLEYLQHNVFTIDYNSKYMYRKNIVGPLFNIICSNIHVSSSFSSCHQYSCLKGVYFSNIVIQTYTPYKILHWKLMLLNCHCPFFQYCIFYSYSFGNVQVCLWVSWIFTIKILNNAFRFFITFISLMNCIVLYSTKLAFYLLSLLLVQFHMYVENFLF